MIVVVRDANDQYFSLAFGVVKNETEESCSWFLKLLSEDVETNMRWMFILD